MRGLRSRKPIGFRQWVVHCEACYLFPFRDGEKDPFARHIFVARFEAGRVVEEYNIDGDQIVYEKYGYLEEDKVEYYCINYVMEGSKPVLYEEEKVFHKNFTKN